MWLHVHKEQILPIYEDRCREWKWIFKIATSFLTLKSSTLMSGVLAIEMFQQVDRVCDVRIPANLEQNWISVLGCSRGGWDSCEMASFCLCDVHVEENMKPSAEHLNRMKNVYSPGVGAWQTEPDGLSCSTPAQVGNERLSTTERVYIVRVLKYTHGLASVTFGAEQRDIKVAYINQSIFPITGGPLPSAEWQ